MQAQAQRGYWQAQQNYGWKPGVAERLSAGHPLLHGLIGAWLFNEAVGGPQDLVRRTTGALQGGAAWATGPAGLGVKFAANADYVQIADDAIYRPTKVSVYVLITVTSNPGSFGIAAYNGSDASYAATNWGCGVRITNNRFWFNDGTSTRDSNNNAWALNVPVGLGATHDGATCSFYMDGVPWGSPAAAALNTGNTQGQRFGGVGTSIYLPGLVHVGYIWNRILTAAEMFILGSQPYAMIDAIGSQFQYAVPGGAPPPSQPPSSIYIFD